MSLYGQRHAAAVGATERITASLAKNLVRASSQCSWSCWISPQLLTLITLVQDIRVPVPVSSCSGQAFRVVIFDPPFFYVPMEQAHAAVLVACGGDTTTKLMLSFLKREEPLLLETFKAFNLKRTKFVLEYAHVKPNKWRNYALYSNVDLPGIKRVT